MSRDEQLGFDEGTLRLLGDIENVTRKHGMARIQQALASALWRSCARHPTLAMTVDFDVTKISLENGGRDLRVEARMFPPRKGKGERQ